MKKCYNPTQVFEQIRNGGKTFKPELYQSISNTEEYRNYMRDYFKQEENKQKIRDVKVAEFLRNVCGAKGNTLKEMLK